MSGHERQGKTQPSWAKVCRIILYMVVVSAIPTETSAMSDALTRSTTSTAWRTSQSVSSTSQRGAHVCRSQGTCCPGWSRSASSGLCNVPVCSGSCGSGVCTAPNVCTHCQRTAQGVQCTRRTPVQATGNTRSTPFSTDRTAMYPSVVRGYQADSSTRSVTLTGTVSQVSSSSSRSAGTICRRLGCQHSCVMLSTGRYMCTCPSGYRIASDGRRCQDINECAASLSSRARCQQGCQNLLGGYRCTCNTGFQISANGQTCRSLGCYSCDGGVQPSGNTCPPGFSIQEGPRGPVCIDINECMSGTCDQECINKEGGYSCECGRGYTLSTDGQTCHDIDECSVEDEMPCHHGCINSRGSYRCTCEEGFYLHSNGRSCIDINECRPLRGFSPCQYACQNSHGSYQCLCGVGYELCENGHTCQDINECVVDNTICGSSSQCINTQGSYRCSCEPGFRESGSSCTDINECRENPSVCTHVCTNIVGSYVCSCHRGYILAPDGRSCTNLQDCSSFGGRACEFNCQNTPGGGFTCICPPGFELAVNGQDCQDVNECVMHRGICQYQCKNTRGSYMCLCPPGFNLARDGHSCEDIDECQTASHGCAHGCVNTKGSFRCICPRGAVGCQEEIQCGPMTCSHQCRNTYNGFMCDCPSGMALASDGRTCQDIDECEEPDQGGCEHSCRNTLGSYYCVCREGFRLHANQRSCVSNHCEDCGPCPAGFKRNRDTERCEDVDECSPASSAPLPCRSPLCRGSDTCSHSCVNTPGSYYCACPIGYSLRSNGHTCFREEEPSQCQPMCANGGDCIGGVCHCPAGLTGVSCSIDIDECRQIDGHCEYQCRNNFGSFQCVCPHGSSLNADGTSCSKISCFPICMHGGACQDGSCLCPPGFTGTSCQMDVNECSVNNGGCDYICRNTPGSYVCFCWLPVPC